jgi:hypothetical protein
VGVLIEQLPVFQVGKMTRAGAATTSAHDTIEEAFTYVTVEYGNGHTNLSIQV